MFEREFTFGLRCPTSHRASGLDFDRLVQAQAKMLIDAWECFGSEDSYCTITMKTYTYNNAPDFILKHDKVDWGKTQRVAWVKMRIHSEYLIDDELVNKLVKFKEKSDLVSRIFQIIRK